jgi:hypothetical protein
MILVISEKESERRELARAHETAMQEKYGRLNGMFNAFDDYHYWYEEKPEEPGYYRHDYPLPYSDLYYFRRFAELFFSHGAEDYIRPTLAHEFPAGDEVDAEYIESLLIKAEALGFFNPGALIYFHGSVLSHYPPPAKRQRYLLGPIKGGYRESYDGSKANKQRAKAIRQWLKQRATESATISSLAIPPPTSPWQPLLVGKMDLPTFFDFLIDCGLRTADGQLTTLGEATGERKDQKAPWFGTLRALMDAGQLDNNAARVCRAMEDPSGQIQIALSENGLRYLSNKADTYLLSANGRLKVLGLLRK